MLSFFYPLLEMDGIRVSMAGGESLNFQKWKGMYGYSLAEGKRRSVLSSKRREKGIRAETEKWRCEITRMSEVVEFITVVPSYFTKMPFCSYGKMRAGSTMLKMRWRSMGFHFTRISFAD